MKNISPERHEELVQRRHQLQRKIWVNNTLRCYKTQLKHLDQKGVSYHLYLWNHPFVSDNTNYELYAQNAPYWQWIEKHFPIQYNGLNWSRVPNAVHLESKNLRFSHNLPEIVKKLTQQYTIEDTEVSIFWAYKTGTGPSPSFRMKWSTS